MMILMINCIIIIDFFLLLFPVKLTRLSGYIVLNVYVPTMFLLLVSYFTLYFNIAIFPARVMCAFTSLLVTSTIFTQVSRINGVLRLHPPECIHSTLFLCHISYVMLYLILLEHFAA